MKKRMVIGVVVVLVACLTTPAGVHGRGGFGGFHGGFHGHASTAANAPNRLRRTMRFARGFPTSGGISRKIGARQNRGASFSGRINKALRSAP